MDIIVGYIIIFINRLGGKFRERRSPDEIVYIAKIKANACLAIGQQCSDSEITTKRWIISKSGRSLDGRLTGETIDSAREIPEPIERRNEEIRFSTRDLIAFFNSNNSFGGDGRAFFSILINPIYSLLFPPYDIVHLCILYLDPNPRIGKVNKRLFLASTKRDLEHPSDPPLFLGIAGFAVIPPAIKIPIKTIVKPIFDVAWSLSPPIDLFPELIRPIIYILSFSLWSTT
ncbi:MAG: hypothetical protein V2B20_25660 [Pseudomonadota bacterium]